MKKLVLIVALLFTSIAPAMSNEELFEAIIELIEKHLDDDDKPPVVIIDEEVEIPSWKTNKVLFEESGDNILLGRVFLVRDGSDSVRFPHCDSSRNRWINRLRLVVRRADVVVEVVKITFQNGDVQTVRLSNFYKDGERSDWIPLAGDGARCIKGIWVKGAVVSDFFQWEQESEFSFSKKSEVIILPEPEHPGRRAVLNFIGAR